MSRNMLIAMHFVVAVPFPLFFGFYADKYNKFKILVLVILSLIIANILFICSPSPYHATAYISMMFFGVTSAGLGTLITQIFE